MQSEWRGLRGLVSLTAWTSVDTAAVGAGVGAKAPSLYAVNRFTELRRPAVVSELANHARDGSGAYVGPTLGRGCIRLVFKFYYSVRRQ